MSRSFIQDIRAKAATKNLIVAFPDAEDIRTLQAARILADAGIGRPVLVGNPSAIAEIAAGSGLSTADIAVVDPVSDKDKDPLIDRLFEKRKAKGWSRDQAAEAARTPLYFAGMMLETGRVNAVVGGNLSSTGDVIRAAIHTVGTAPGISTVSSYFLMVLPDRLLSYADGAVMPNPTDVQLADIAVTTAKNYKAVTGRDPLVAMLSFSTKGSASHPDVDKVVSAVKIARDKAPDLLLDGELQADAALIPSIGERKCKGSPVAGKANVLIFPDLDAGNIAYKLTERLAGAEAIGPIVQGLNKPYCDLSRGCSADDMVNVAAICSLMA
jgi:phosphate acetyltransferase